MPAGLEANEAAEAAQADPLDQLESEADTLSTAENIAEKGKEITPLPPGEGLDQKAFDFLKPRCDKDSSTHAIMNYAMRKVGPDAYRMWKIEE